MENRDFQLTHNSRSRRVPHRPTAYALGFTAGDVGRQNSHPMTSELAKTISTSAVWVSTAVLTTFGLFRMNFNGELGGVILLLIVVAVFAGATLGTIAIWSPWLLTRHAETRMAAFEVLQPKEKEQEVAKQ